MSITEQMQQDVITAMKARDKERVSALRMIVCELQKAVKETKGDFGEEQELKVLMAEKKKRQQAADGFRDGGRAESAAKEESEAAIIDTYLPQAMDEVELAALVDEAVASTGAEGIREMGKVMSALMSKVAGRADGKMVSDMVRKRLGG
ncbi:MAG: GatB/YqeY domain-containing protein [Thermoleophilia bacterium]|nr:GatB/YqeY domain-containing protein [Thermoleophilia bacterium]